MRSKALVELLNSVKIQSKYPDEIIIIDGSTNLETKIVLENQFIKNANYFLVSDENRGLTKQRNFGINKVSQNSNIVCFLDDDTILNFDYFEKLISTYINFPNALGVGGYIINEVNWKKADVDYKLKISDYFYDGWIRKEGSRFIIRKILGLDSNLPPCFLPKFSHGRSVSFLPPTNKIYEVEQFMGGVSSFNKKVFNTIKFSTFFEGYGLYEDADFTLRLSKIGKLYVNTNAKLSHYHDDSGRPNYFKYGKMVIRNGWYVWRVKYPNPKFKDRLKWNLIALILTIIRFTNVITTPKKKQAFNETLGRILGWISLLFNKPKVIN